MSAFKRCMSISNRYTRALAKCTTAFGSLRATAERDGENIRALARIAEIHERRLTALDGGSGEAQ
jgi:hypothetical protein